MTVWRVVAAASATFVLWLVPATAHLWTKLFHAQSIERLGQWGDSFGAFSALASAGAFIGAIYAIVQQQSQIEQARHDQDLLNRAARNEQHKQRFDTTFFEILRLLRENRDAVKFRHSQTYISSMNFRIPANSPAFIKARRDSKQEFSGTEAFIAAWREFRFHQRAISTLTKAQAAAIYEKDIHGRFESNLGPYFRLMYTVLARLRGDKILSEDEKLEYGRLLRGQLTSYETALAGLNGLSKVSKDFPDLIVMFRILRYLPTGNRKRTLSKFYPPETFEARD